MTQIKNGFQKNGGWEGMADYSCQINEYGFTDEMLRENKDGTKKNKTGKNLNENLNLYSIEIVLYFF